ncbi:uncharacterized protein FOMMEDRAFT_151687 [Fomitiporia mediterranea MF3/22]|uniref:uncharacterized protein n=1 Tax=Fomitiporia mediterranea (strain MF3/22) TaxID=694068 RepID=UPI00044075A9|nr:uncharacterized protein FOMMEDRAFT_151687 [Fomitiporia mediterranea MF3/22]EJD06424.1 hypothetical protein FOMMEDRAFT_151687 [Fomitiporia mediterranea MF3/22]
MDAKPSSKRIFSNLTSPRTSAAKLRYVGLDSANSTNIGLPEREMGLLPETSPWVYCTGNFRPESAYILEHLSFVTKTLAHSAEEGAR